jgi:hypothetical protein
MLDARRGRKKPLDHVSRTVSDSGRARELPIGDNVARVSGRDRQECLVYP